MDKRVIFAIVILAVPFGIIGSVMAFMNAYSGWSHFPGISRKKKTAFAVEMAVLAFIMAIICSGVALFLFRGQ
ncbi:MAG TPA: hypothetical protein PLM53_13635 [Spirochaetota bacterium]|nr:hypothetical protein [Spirochaetota bacterium]HPC43044.1 hypothetical protein [Spirochaetota bacterium]HPL17718.1 hypothetical protein [Spirochaetota bacterium]HQF09454.1 hypothetical protein [Spirochaetota bacterium]HQH98137.1 hypothetical protein [Spirochaetota bacterium]